MSTTHLKIGPYTACGRWIRPRVTASDATADVTCGTCKRGPGFTARAEAERREAAEIRPSAVVVDTKDGYTFWAGSDGALFTEGTARRFAFERNAAMKPEHRSYRVFTLTAATP